MKKTQNKKKPQAKKPVCYPSQTWKTFADPPEIEDCGYGPSGVDLWIYYPKNKYITDWTNWSGSLKDIMELLDEKAMWCYSVEPNAPGIK